MFTDHGEQVRMVHRAVPVFALIQVGPVQDSGHHEAKVGSKRVDGHGASSISGLKQSKPDFKKNSHPIITELFGVYFFFQ